MPWHECRRIALERMRKMNDEREREKTRWARRIEDEGRRELKRTQRWKQRGPQDFPFTWSRYAFWPSRRARANDRTCTLLCTWSGSCRLIGKIHGGGSGIVCSAGKSRVKHARKWHDRGLKLDRSAALDSEMRGFCDAISGRGRKVHRVVSSVVNCRSCLVHGQSVLCNELIPWKRS